MIQERNSPTNPQTNQAAMANGTPLARNPCPQPLSATKVGSLGCSCLAKLSWSGCFLALAKWLMPGFYLAGLDCNPGRYAIYSLCLLSTLELLAQAQQVGPIRACRNSGSFYFH